MAHMIDMSNGRANIAFTNEVPWHGLGIPMRKGQPLEEWRIEAGLTWQAEPRTLQILNAKGEAVTLASHKGLARSDNDALLSIVSADYMPVQPLEVVEFFRDLVDRHGYEMDCCGALRDGRVIWATAKCGVTARIKGQDEVHGYLLLATSYDKSMATTARFTSIRTVCNNTLTAAYRGGAHVVSVPHSTTFDAARVKVDLGIGDAWAQHVVDVEQLASIEVSPAQTVDFFLRTYYKLRGDATTPEYEVAAKDLLGQDRVEAAFQRFVAILQQAPGQSLRSANGTAWGLVNAVTFDMDHTRRERAPGNRFASSAFGTGEQTKLRAFAAAQALALAA